MLPIMVAPYSPSSTIPSTAMSVSSNTVPKYGIFNTSAAVVKLLVPCIPVAAPAAEDEPPPVVVSIPTSEPYACFINCPLYFPEPSLKKSSFLTIMPFPSGNIRYPSLSPLSECPSIWNI